MSIFKLPDLGEGLPDAEINQWYVKVGDEVAVDTPLVAMETAKAVVDVPSPVAGKIKELFGEKGTVIKTGEPLVAFEGEVALPEVHEGDTGTVAGQLEVGETVMQAPTLKAGSGAKVVPAIRALARKLKVDIHEVTPTGPNGTITKQDVEAYANLSSQTGVVESLSSSRRMMADTMIASHQQVVDVTVVEDAILSQWPEGEDITVRVILAIQAGILKEPSLNAWYDHKTKSLRTHQNLSLGLAVDTEEGLFVPVLKDLDKTHVKEIRKAVDTLKAAVQLRAIQAEQMRGATFTLSNFGRFSGRYANPIIVPPQVAILGVGSLREQVIPVKGEMVISKVLPLSLTFDHRAVTGGEATRFLGTVIKHLEAERAAGI